MNVQTKPAEAAAVLVAELGRRAKAAAVALRNASTEAKNRALAEAARLIRAEKAAILAANAKDMDAAKAAGMDAALQDRLLLNEARVEAMARRGRSNTGPLTESLSTTSTSAFSTAARSASCSAV